MSVAARFDGDRLLRVCCDAHVIALAVSYQRRPFIPEVLWSGQITRAVRPLGPLGWEEMYDRMVATGLGEEQVMRAITWQEEHRHRLEPSTRLRRLLVRAASVPAPPDPPRPPARQGCRTPAGTHQYLPSDDRTHLPRGRVRRSPGSDGSDRGQRRRTPGGSPESAPQTCPTCASARTVSHPTAPPSTASLPAPRNHEADARPRRLPTPTPTDPAPVANSVASPPITGQSR